jgi:hypothetical protein
MASNAIFGAAAVTGNPISVGQWERFVGSLRAADGGTEDVAVSHDHADAMVLQLDDLAERLERLGERTASAVRGVRRLQASVAAAGGRTVPRRGPDPPGDAPPVPR